MSWRHYDTERAAAYDRERSAPDAHLAEVRAVVVDELAAVAEGPVLDLGAGTGLWSDRLVRWTGRQVVAIEPSTAMIDRLAGKRLADVEAVQAGAERLPLADGGVSAAWLSTVVHHFADLTAAVAETARVLAPGGLVLVRSSFPDQASGEAYPTRFFSRAASLADRYPTTGAVAAAFARSGLELVRRYTPREVAAATRRDLLDRTRTRADSLLREMADDEFAAGVAQLRCWVEADPECPVHFEPDVLVFG